jgi:hypothetical protein
MKKIINGKIKDLKLHEQIEFLCNKHSLGKEVKNDIMDLCKKSYIKGSNDCHEIWKILT